jgi:hypothetical protein
MARHNGRNGTGAVAGRGRPAALPDAGYQPPARLLLDGGRCVVRVTREDGRASKEFDFARLPVGRGLQVAFARAFDRRAGPSGTRKSMHTAIGAYESLGRFARHLAAMPAPPTHPEELAPGHLASYVLQRKHLRTFDREFGALKRTLQAVEGLSAPFTAKLAELTLPRPAAETLASYSPAEFARILTTARREARAAVERIRTHRALLVRWRAGRVDNATDPAGWKLGQILDHVERHGDVPRYPNREWQPLESVARHGTVPELVSLIHLPWHEAAAFLVLLIGLTGENGGTIADAPAPHHRADGGAGGTPTALVDLEKPRRGRRRHMTVALADLPDDLPEWIPVGGAPPASAKDELRTPLGAYLLLLELTAPARRIVGTDRLFVSWSPKGHVGGRGFRVGMTKDMVPRWAHRHGLPADPQPGADPDTPPPPLRVTMPLLRLSVLQRQQRPVAHTDQTLASQYLGRDRGNLADYQRLVATVLDEQVAKAKSSVLPASLTDADVGQAGRDPEGVAARVGLDTATLKRVVAGELDTVLAACVDHTNSPYAPVGEPCRASFLLCLGCPCARAAPQHLPIQTLVLDAFEARRADLPPLEWARRFALPHAQLTDLLDRFPPAAVATARAAATAADRRLVERLFARELDHP